MNTKDNCLVTAEVYVVAEWLSRDGTYPGADILPDGDPDDPMYYVSTWVDPELNSTPDRTPWIKASTTGPTEFIASIARLIVDRGVKHVSVTSGLIDALIIIEDTTVSPEGDIGALTIVAWDSPRAVVDSAIEQALKQRPDIKVTKC